MEQSWIKVGNVLLSESKATEHLEALQKEKVAYLEQLKIMIDRKVYIIKINQPQGGQYCLETLAQRHAAELRYLWAVSQEVLYVASQIMGYVTLSGTSSAVLGEGVLP